MAGNTIGQLFRVTTFGESHGLALGCIVDGVPPGIPLTEADLQHDLDRRRPGTSRYTTQRREPDQVKILSGVFEGVTTGTSIGLLIENTDQRSQDYSAIKDVFRPGHADYTYEQKYGLRDYRGGGKSGIRSVGGRSKTAKKRGNQGQRHKKACHKACKLSCRAYCSYVFLHGSCHVGISRPEIF